MLPLCIMHVHVKLGAQALAVGRGIVLMGGSASKCLSLVRCRHFHEKCLLKELPETCISQWRLL
jgi:hypothetical protein